MRVEGSEGGGEEREREEEGDLGRLSDTDHVSPHPGIL